MAPTQPQPPGSHNLPAESGNAAETPNHRHAIQIQQTRIAHQNALAVSLDHTTRRALSFRAED